METVSPCITADSSGGIDVLTNGGSGNDRAIWHYTSGSGWAQQSGSGTALAGNFDTNSHTPGSGGSGTINPGGFYILNSVGAIYYENTDQSFAQLPGSASGIAPTTNGGVFVLGYPIAGGAGGPLPTQTGFYLWKAMVIDIARGVALQSGTHPIGGWDTSPSTPVPLSRFYLDPAFNQYAYLVHKNMIGNRSYTLQYDEPGGLAPTFTSNPAQPMQVTIWNIPTYSRATPTVTATPQPCPP